MGAARILEPDTRIIQPTQAEILAFDRRPGARNNRGRVGAKGGAGSPPAPSTPVTIISSTTINAWLRTDVGVTGGATASAWADQGAAHNDYLQGGAPSIQPTVNAGGPNSFQYLTFDGADDYMTSTFTPGATGFLWMVIRRNSADATSRYLYNASSSGSNRFSLNQNSAPAIRMLNTTAANTTNMATATWMLVWASFTNSVADELKVGSAAATTGANAGGTGGLGGSWLGCAGNLTGFMGFDILELLICAAKPTEIAALTSYVTTTWAGGVQV